MNDPIHSLINTIPLPKLRGLFSNIMERYRGDTPHKGIASVHEAIAYLAYRAPATTAVQSRVFQELVNTNLNPQSFLDLGAGMGLSATLIQEIFPGIKDVTAIEENPHMIEVGKKLALDTKWLKENYVTIPLPQANIVMASYTFSELPATTLRAALEKAWAATNKALVLIEPGTLAGAKVLQKCREFLIQNQGFIYAPCGHNGPCPMAPRTNDWCHFSVRLERTKIHKDIKGGILPYEDEKYSYLIATKENLAPSYKRILHTPQQRKGQVQLDLCTPGKVDRHTFTKAKSPNFKVLKKLDWGDRLDLDL